MAVEVSIFELDSAGLVGFRTNDFWSIFNQQSAWETTNRYPSPREFSKNLGLPGTGSIFLRRRLIVESTA